FVLALLRYPWPGNVRELQGALDKAVADTPQDKKLSLEYLELERGQEVIAGVQAMRDEEVKTELYGTLASILRQEGFEEGAGLHTQMAALLEVSPATVTRMAQRAAGQGRGTNA